MLFWRCVLKSRFILCLLGLSLAIAACDNGGNPTFLAGPTAKPPATSVPTAPSTLPPAQKPTPTPTPSPTATPKPTIQIVGLPAGPLSPNTAYQVSVVETIGGAPATPGMLTLSLDNATVGKTSGSILVAGVTNASGTLTVTDSSHGLTATAAVTVASTHPATNGDIVTLAGSIVQTIARPLPAPTATQPVYTGTTAVTIATTTTTGATFNGMSGLTDFKSVEVDTSQSPVIAKTTMTDAYQMLVANGTAINVVTPGSAATDSNGNAFTTMVGSGNGVLDILPEVNGATFANNAASMFAETDADSTTVARTTNADGTYAETDKFADTSSQQIAINADLSGSISTLRGTRFMVTVPPPTTGANSVINYTLTRPGPNPTSTPRVVTIPVKTWYPTKTLASDTATTTTTQAIPASCNVPAAVGTNATAIAETVNLLDPVLGTFETRITTSYVAPFFGVACVQIADKFDMYYDYTGQTRFIVFVSSTPIQTTTTTETIGLKTANVAGAPKFGMTTRASSAGVVRRSFAAAKTSFERTMQRVYGERRRTMHATLSHAPTLQQVNR